MKGMDSETSQLLRRWHAGERAALDKLLADHLPWLRDRVHRLLSPLLRLRGDTMDYVDDVLLRLLRDIPRFHISNSRLFRGLLLQIVVNELKDKQRFYTAARRDMARERPLASVVLELDPPLHTSASPSQVAQRHEEEAIVRLALELLECEQRDVIVLRDWKKLAFADIGARLEITPDAARMRHGRAVQLLSRVVGALRRGTVESLITADGGANTNGKEGES
ncbi:MAG: RNA polymerase sigma factor [Planctomycetota bacterium]